MQNIEEEQIFEKVAMFEIVITPLPDGPFCPPLPDGPRSNKKGQQ
jgi:hypothetical protein